MPSRFHIEMTVLKQINENGSNYDQYEKSCGCNFCEQGEPEWHLSLMPEPLTYLH
ncbi:Uncharacterised protein [Chlamydia trachomatis]|nr:Uncharacterised protein [Chlamydia trachomatis]